MHMVTMNNRAYKLLLRANAFAVSHQLPFFLSFIVWYTYEGLLWSCFYRVTDECPVSISGVIRQFKHGPKADWRHLGCFHSAKLQALVVECYL